MEALRNKLDDIRAAFDRLSSREKMLVLFIAGIAVLAVVLFITFRINVSLANLDSRLDIKRDNFKRISDIQGRYGEAKAQIESLQDLIKNNKDNVTSDLGTLSSELGIDPSQISRAKEAVDKKAKIREKAYKITFRKTELEPLLTLFEGIEKKNNLTFIKSIKMNRRYNETSLDVSFTISTIVPLDE